MGGCPRNCTPERMWFPWGHRHLSQSWGGAVTTVPNSTLGHRIHCTGNQNLASFFPWEEFLFPDCSVFMKRFWRKKAKVIRWWLATSQMLAGCRRKCFTRGHTVPAALRSNETDWKTFKNTFPRLAGWWQVGKEEFSMLGVKVLFGKADRCSIYMRKPSYCYPNLSESLTWHLS